MTTDENIAVDQGTTIFETGYDTSCRIVYELDRERLKSYISWPNVSIVYLTLVFDRLAYWTSCDVCRGKMCPVTLRAMKNEIEVHF